MKISIGYLTSWVSKRASIIFPNMHLIRLWIGKVWTRKPLQTCLDLPKENRENLGLAGYLEVII
jgi:hypothetical protein